MDVQAKIITNTTVKEIQKKSKAGQYKEALLTLEEANGGFIKPRDVVQAAKAEDSPLHDVFEWDDSVASEKYRLMQARLLIYQVKVTIEGVKRPAYFNANVTINREPIKAYFPIKKVLDEPDLHQVLLQSAVKDLKNFVKKYKTLSELTDVVDQDKLKEIEMSL